MNIEVKENLSHYSKAYATFALISDWVRTRYNTGVNAEESII